MGNIILRPYTDFIDYTVTASSANSSYPVANVENYNHPNKHYRSEVKTSAVNLVFDMTTATVVAAVFLNNVNFENVTVEGNATDSWGSPSFSEGKTISLDKRVQRRKGFFTLTSFNYRYLRLSIPADQGSESYYRIDNVVLLSSAQAIVKNIQTPYKYLAGIPTKKVEFIGGQEEIISLGLRKQFSCGLSFQGSLSSQLEEDLLGKIDDNLLFVYYENGLGGGGTEKSYLVRAELKKEVSWSVGNFKFNEIELKEVI